MAAGYPRETELFLKNRKDRFANPVGHIIEEGLEGVFEGLLEDRGPEGISDYLDKLLRVRAVQDFTASQALAFIFALKRLVRDALAGREGEFSAELSELDAVIDGLALMGFDIYMRCREKLYDIKADEAKNMTFRLLQRANLIVGAEPAAPGGAAGCDRAAGDDAESNEKEVTP